MDKSLTNVGTVQLIKVVIFVVQVYWSQLFLLPKNIIKMIEVVCRSYLWSDKATNTKRDLVAWD